jgi:hypothetical protein
MWPVRKPFYLISGWLPCVSDHQRTLLEALSRKIDATPNQVMTELSEINSMAADNSNGYVSRSAGRRLNTQMMTIGNPQH